MPSSSDIRRAFIDYFVRQHGHTFVPSSPVIPHGDPTLMFTNAGMNQFKDVFLGQGSRPYRRAVNSQKCIRAGGKHNDLEDVGRDGYHHTFFEMLGNWSFGDYFKAEAIEWAWTLLTDVWGLDPQRLYVTVFAGDAADGLEPDTEAEDLWKRHVDPARVSRWDRKDNFWEMGESGPCGPCSEIHYDGRPDAERAASSGAELVNRGHGDVIEIWNLVFIQFNRGGDGRLTPLPDKHVDTGMGFERIVRVIQGRTSNYDTDLWTPIFEAIRAESGAPAYGGVMDEPRDVAYRVIADHVRCLTIALSDGGRPGNEKAGYVLRRILRRAVRHAHQTLAVQGPLLHRIVPAVVDSLGEAFPELSRSAAHVAEIVREEELSFLRTLDRGLALFADAADRAAERDGRRVVLAEDAFRLHDTYGFPIDLTRVMAEEHGLGVDLDGYERLMEEAREVSRRGAGDEAAITLPPEALASLRRISAEPTDDSHKHEGKPITAKVLAIWNGTDFDDVVRTGGSVAVVLSRTNHYAAAGGQVADEGAIESEVVLGTTPVRGYHGTSSTGGCRYRVEDVQAIGGYVLHIGRVIDGALRVGDRVTATIERQRREPVRANHTATHLLNLALRHVIGPDEDQRGSLVAPDRLRFDFACPHALDESQVERVQTMVNEAIEQGLAVHARVIPLEQAMSISSIRAVFGEKYPDPVRVVCIGPPLDEVLADPASPRWSQFSIELCGGTHMRAASEAERFVIVHEQALAAGIRRVTAFTGAAAVEAERAGEALVERARAAGDLQDEALERELDDLTRLGEELVVGALHHHELRALLEPLRERVRHLRKQAKAASRSGVVDEARAIAAESSGTVIVAEIQSAEGDDLLSAMDVIRGRHPEAAIMLLSADHGAGKVAIAARVADPLIKRGLKAGDWVREAAKVCGGGGGGRPDMAQAGGRDPAKLAAAIDAARAFATAKLGIEAEV